MTLASAVHGRPEASRGSSERSAPEAKEKPTERTAASDSWQDRLTELLVKHRWATVVPVVLPLSKAYDTYWTARHVVYRNLRNAAHRHGERVSDVQKQIEGWHARGKPGLLHTSRKSWQSVAVRAIEYKKRSQSGIDVDLHDILEVDLSRRIVRVEPRVN